MFPYFNRFLNNSRQHATIRLPPPPPPHCHHSRRPITSRSKCSIIIVARLAVSAARFNGRLCAGYYYSTNSEWRLRPLQTWREHGVCLLRPPWSGHSHAVSKRIVISCSYCLKRRETFLFPIPPSTTISIRAFDWTRECYPPTLFERGKKKKKKIYAPSVPEHWTLTLFFFSVRFSCGKTLSSWRSSRWVGGFDRALVGIDSVLGFIFYICATYSRFGREGGADKATWLIITKLSAVLAVQCAMAAIIN